MFSKLKKLLARAVDKPIEQLPKNFYTFSGEIPEVDRLRLQLETVTEERDVYFQNWMAAERRGLANIKAREGDA